MFPDLKTVDATGAPPNGSGMFERVDRFSFMDRLRGRMTVSTLPLDGLTVATVRSTGHDIALQEGGRTTILMPLIGRISVESKNAVLEAPSGGLMYLPAGYRLTRVRPSDGGEFLATVALVNERRWRHGRTPPGQSFVPGRMVGAEALRGFLSYFVDEFDKPMTALRRPAALRAARALLVDLIAGIAKANVPAARSVMAPSARVRAAEEIMRARSDEALTVEELAREVGVGPRALQIAFRAVRGASPRAILSAHRLDRARERLLAARHDESVTDIAFASGIAHLGRFATAYRKRFGESPSETLRRRR